MTVSVKYKGLPCHETRLFIKVAARNRLDTPCIRNGKTLGAVAPHARDQTATLKRPKSRLLLLRCPQAGYSMADRPLPDDNCVTLGYGNLCPAVPLQLRPCATTSGSLLDACLDPQRLDSAISKRPIGPRAPTGSVFATSGPSHAQIGDLCRRTSYRAALASASSDFRELSHQ